MPREALEALRDHLFGPRETEPGPPNTVSPEATNEPPGPTPDEVYARDFVKRLFGRPEHETVLPADFEEAD